MKAEQNILDVSQVKQLCDHIRKEISAHVVGYEQVIDDLLVCLISKGHLFMIGVPGIAKTTLAKTFAQATGLSWNRIQFTQDMLPSDILGHYYYNQKTQEFNLRKGPVFSELVLADEINRSTPKTQSALIEAMQERQVTIEGTTMHLPHPFLVLATKNPIETEGVYPLPEAQLDRFLYSVEMDYLPKDQELRMLAQKNKTREKPQKIIAAEEVKQLIGMHHRVYAEQSILRYIVDIIDETRNHNQLVMGASPRAGEHLLYASKAFALINGREYVIPDDVRAVAPKVLTHRLILSTDADLEGISRKKIIDDIISTVAIPDIVESPALHVP
ncbi:MAG: MoxR family ATPase [Thermoplasmatota archaeon]